MGRISVFARWGEVGGSIVVGVLCVRELVRALVGRGETGRMWPGGRRIGQGRLCTGALHYSYVREREQKEMRWPESVGVCMRVPVGWRGERKACL